MNTAGVNALRLDLVAGLTGAAVVLPKAMAYATVAGLPVAVGLYTAFIPMLVYALLGSSRVLSVISTTTLAILAGTQLGLVVPDGDPAKLVTATATLGALVGVMLFLARLLRLGFVANFISTPVLTGFKAGIGLVIVLDQIPKLVGIHITQQGFFADVVSVVRRMEFRWALIACLGVLVFGTLKGIVVAIIVSMIALASQTAVPRVLVIGRKRGADVLRPLSPKHPDDETFEGLLIVRPEGRLFFVNVQNVSERIDALVKQYQPRVLALDMGRVSDIEYSALLALMQREERATGSGAVLWLAGLNPGVLEVVRRAGLDQRLGRERMLFNGRAVIERYQALQAAGEGGHAVMAPVNCIR